MADGQRQTTPRGDAFTAHEATRDGNPPEQFTWNMFPGLAIELGGYNDVELVDPYTGRRFWYQPARERWADLRIEQIMVEAIQLATERGWFSDGE